MGIISDVLWFLSLSPSAREHVRSSHARDRAQARFLIASATLSTATTAEARRSAEEELREAQAGMVEHFSDEERVDLERDLQAALAPKRSRKRAASK